MKDSLLVQRLGLENRPKEAAEKVKQMVWDLVKEVSNGKIVIIWQPQYRGFWIQGAL